MRRRMNGTGTMFPSMLTISAVTGVSPMPTPMGRAPLNSITGTMDMKKVHSIFPKYVDVNQVIIGGL